MKEIRQSSGIEQWKYCSTTENPADLISKQLPHSVSNYDRDDPNVSINCNIFQQRLKNALDHFWGKWRIDLREQQKNKGQSSKEPLIKVGDIVLVHDEKVPRHLWQLGKVEQLIPSRDNKVRGALVRTPNHSILKRSVSRLYPVETGPDNISNLVKRASVNRKSCSPFIDAGVPAEDKDANEGERKLNQVGCST